MTKRFYYAQSNDAYVTMSVSDYNLINELIDLNAKVFDENEDVCLPEEILAIDPEFYNRERQIQQLLHMSDDEFADLILY